MSSEILVAILSLAGTLLGSLSGVLASSKLPSYRHAQREKKVVRHNGFGERIRAGGKTQGRQSSSGRSGGGDIQMKERLTRLLCIKSLVTLVTTLVFAVLAVIGRISAREFLTIYTVVISFYFGTQFEKNGGTK